MANRFREKPVEEPAAARPEEEAAETVAQPEPDTGEREEETQSESAKPARQGWLTRVLGGDVLASRMVRRQIPLLLLCVIYMLLIVGNRYRVEKLSREKEASETRVENLREQRILLQEQYQQSVKISQIAEELKETGVGITAGPPYEIEK